MLNSSHHSHCLMLWTVLGWSMQNLLPLLNHFIAICFCCTFAIMEQLQIYCPPMLYSNCTHTVCWFTDSTPLEEHDVHLHPYFHYTYHWLTKCNSCALCLHAHCPRLRLTLVLVSPYSVSRCGCRPLLHKLNCSTVFCTSASTAERLYWEAAHRIRGLPDLLQEAARHGG